MRPLKDREKYISARAEGQSIRQASKAAGISKGTGQQWEAKLSETIAREKSSMMEELSKEYGLTKKGRMEAIGKLLKKLQGAVDSIDLENVPPEKLLGLYLRTIREAAREYVPYSEKIDSGDFDGLVADMLKRIVSGELQPEQAYAETRALGTAAEIYKTTTLQRKVEELEGVLEELKAELNELKTEN